MQAAGGMRGSGTVAAPIDFYFEFASPYGYLASTQIDAIAARHGREVFWHPIMLGAAFKLTGAQPLMRTPLKGDYMMHDLPRFARLLGVPFTAPPVMPANSLAASRACIWLEQDDPRQGQGAGAGRLSRPLGRGAGHRSPGRCRRYRRAARHRARRSARSGGRPGDQGAPEAGDPGGDRARRVRLAVRAGRRRGLLGRRSPGPGRALARRRRLVRRRG